MKRPVSEHKNKKPQASISTDELALKLKQAYDEYSDAIFRYCTFKVSDREKAIDLTQDVFVKVWQYLLSGNEVENMKALLYKVARNLIIDEYRKKKFDSLDTMSEAGFEPADTGQLDTISIVEAGLLVERIKELPDAYSEVVFMRYVDDLSVKEIAEALGEQENNVSVRIHRGLHKLKVSITQTS
jgi:RNA polymerase sigma-70 factor (ECF subfamily)